MLKLVKSLLKRIQPQLQKCKSLKKLIGNHHICEGHRQGGGWNKYAATAQNTQPHKYKQHKYENAQARKHINTQVYTYKKHIQKYTRKQAHKHIKKTNTQAHTYTNPQSHCQKILKLPKECTHCIFSVETHGMFNYLPPCSGSTFL